MFLPTKSRRLSINKKSNGSRRGFTLIEVLVAIVILAFGLVMIVQSMGRTQEILRISQNMVTASQIGVQKLSESEIKLKESIKLSLAHEHGEEKWQGRKFVWNSEVKAYEEADLRDETKLNEADVTVRWQDSTIRKNQARFTTIMMNLEKDKP